MSGTRTEMRDMHKNGYETRTEMRETQMDMSETQTEICEIHHDMNEARKEVRELHHDKMYPEGPLAPEATLRQRCSRQRRGKKTKWAPRTRMSSRSARVAGMSPAAEMSQRSARLSLCSDIPHSPRMSPHSASEPMQS